MHSIVNMFREGGSTMYLVLMFGLAGHAIAIVGLISLGDPVREKLRAFGLTALGLGLVTIGIGWFGYQRGLGMVERALAGVDPEIRHMIREQGEKEAARNIQLGVAACALPILIGAGLAARSLAASRARDAS